MRPMLEGKTAWIIGAAGAIGAEIARVFIKEGARVALSGRHLETLEALSASLPDGSSFIVPMDVTDRAAVDNAASKVIGEFEFLDILVNSTTNPIFADFNDLTDEDWTAVINAKALGYMRTSRAVLPHMAENHSGVIVNISGRGGHQPNSPSHLAGSCANAAVNTLTKGLSNIYGPKGVRLNAIAPGPVRSPRYEKIAAANKMVADKQGTSERSGTVAANPLGEQSEPRDIADAALYLASDLSRFVTGIVLQTDGGGTPSL